MAHDGGGYARPRRRRRRRYSAGPTGRGVGLRGNTPKRHRPKIRTPIRRAPKQYRPGAPAPHYRPRPKAQRGLITSSGKVIHPARDRHSAAHAVQTLGYKATAQRYGKHVANAGRARIQQVRERKQFRNVLRGGKFGAQFTVKNHRGLLGDIGHAAGETAKFLGSHVGQHPELPAKPSDSPAIRELRKAEKISTSPRLTPQRLSDAPAVKAVKKIGKATGYGHRILPGEQPTTVGRGSAVDKAVRKQLGPKGALPKTGHKIARKVEKLHPPGKTTQTQEFPIGKLAGEAIDLAANVPASTAATVQATQEAVSGKPAKLKKLGRDYGKQSAVVALAEGRPGEAVKRFGQHPVASTLEVTGAGGAISRTAGRVARTAPKGSTLHKIGSTERRPKEAPGTSIKVHREYSKGTLGKAVQVGLERHGAKKSKRLYAKAHAIEEHAKNQGHEVRAENTRRKAEGADPNRASEKDLRKRYDVREGLAEPRRRMHRAKVTRQATQALDVKHPDLALLLAQKIVKPTRESVSAYRDQIGHHIKNNPSFGEHPAKRVAAKRLHRQLGDILADKNLDLKAHHEAGVKYSKVVAPLQKKLVQKKILAEEQGRMAPLVPYARQHMGATWNAKDRHLELPVKGGGARRLEASDIEAHMRKNGINPAEVAYVSHRPGAGGAIDYYRAWQRPHEIMGPSRTGHATVEGTHAVSKEIGRANASSMQGLIDAHDEYAAFIKENGLRKHNGKLKGFRSRHEGDQWIRNMQAVRKDQPGGGASTYHWRLVPVRPTFGKADHGRQLLEDAEHSRDISDVQGGLEAAAKGQGEEHTRYVAVPADVADQMYKHLRVLNPTAFGKGMRVGMQAFRGAVLATSPTWLTGNAVEATLRSLVSRSGPTSYKLGRAVLGRLHELDPALAEEVRLRIGEGHFGMQELQAVHTAAESFRGTSAEPLARGLASFRRTPGPKQIAHVWKLYSHAIFKGNGLLEQQFKVAMLGRYVQDFQLKGNALRNWDKAVDQAARGLKDTNEQARAAEWVRRAYGRYEAFSPNQRLFIAQYTPFLAWTLNAYKFLFDVLPRDHPVLTGALAAQHQATGDWRKAHGRGPDTKLPDFLKTTIPVKGGSIPAGRYTPFGVAGDPYGGLESLILPQFSGTLAALQGLDWKGDPLGGANRASEVPDNVKAKAVGTSLLEAFVPILGTTRKVEKYGAQGLNPFRKIRKVSKKQKRKVQSKPEGWGSGGSGFGSGGGWGQ